MIYDQACAWLGGFADGLADEHGMPFTAEYVGMPDFTLHGKERIIYLLPIQQGSAWEGPTKGPKPALPDFDTVMDRLYDEEPDSRHAAFDTLPTRERLLRVASELHYRRGPYRWGQALFNALYELAPEAAEEIRGTGADPYYTDDNLEAFWARLGI